MPHIALDPSFLHS